MAVSLKFGGPFQQFAERVAYLEASLAAANRDLAAQKEQFDPVTRQALVDEVRLASCVEPRGAAPPLASFALARLPTRTRAFSPRAGPGCQARAGTRAQSARRGPVATGGG